MRSREAYGGIKKKQILAAETLVVVDDLYRPYRPKRHARDDCEGKGTGSDFANILLLQRTTKTLEQEAQPFIDPEKEVNTAEEAVQGAMDIIAENISDEADYRIRIREMTEKRRVFDGVREGRRRGVGLRDVLSVLGTGAKACRAPHSRDQSR